MELVYLSRAVSLAVREEMDRVLLPTIGGGREEGTRVASLHQA